MHEIKSFYFLYLLVRRCKNITDITSCYSATLWLKIKERKRTLYDNFLYFEDKTWTCTTALVE